jgi:hypothetical protein
VLHLDLKNYTGLAARLEPDRLAEHIHEIFKSFDRLVYSSQSKAHGLFKIDTIGDACNFPSPPTPPCLPRGSKAQKAYGMRAWASECARDDGMHPAL